MKKMICGNHVYITFGVILDVDIFIRSYFFFSTMISLEYR